MSSDNPTLIPVAFHGDTITCIETPDGEFVAIKPICERLGLALPPQLAKLKGDPELWGVTLIVTPSAGGSQETNCIPRNRMAAWLFKIEVSRVKPEARDALRLYQREAADVLDRHFRLRDEAHVEEIRQLRGQLDHSHSHLKAADPKWGQLLAMMEAGTYSLAVIAKRLNWSQDRTFEEMHAVTRCGMLMPEGVKDNSARSWLDRIEDLERMVQRERDLRMAEARGISLAALRAERDDPDQPSLFEVH